MLRILVRRKLHYLQGLSIIAHCVQNGTLANVRLEEFGVNLDGFVGVLQSLRECSQFCVRIRAIVVAARILRVSLDSLGV